MSNKFYIVYIIVGIISISLFPEVLSQTDSCSTRHARAVTEFYNGNISSSLSILEPCVLNKGAMKRTQRGTRANMYHLAAAGYIMQRDLDMAENMVDYLKKTAPYYQVHEDDLEDYKSLMKRKTARPRLLIGIRLVQNQLRLFESHSIYQKPGVSYTLNDDEKADDFFIGLSVEYTFSRHLSVEACYSGYNMSLVTGTHFDGIKFTMSGFIRDIPIGLKYTFLPDWFPVGIYFYGGVLYRNEKILTSQIINSEYGNFHPLEINFVDHTAVYFENLEGLYPALGTGFSYHLNRFEISSDLRYYPLFGKPAALGPESIIPEYDPLYFYDHITVYRLRHNFEFALTLRIKLFYKVFTSKS